jgi:hypothetical protein
VVLVEHAAENPPSSYRSVDREDDAGIVVRWKLVEALMWTIPIEVRRIPVEDPAGVTGVDSLDDDDFEARSAR